MAHYSLVALAIGDGTQPLAGTVPPTEFRLFTAGEVRTTKGTFIFDEEAAREVLAEYHDQGNRLPIDYDHKSLDDKAPAEAGKAAGWFSIELRGGELWAFDVEWTPAAAAGITAKEWGYYSPAFLVEDETNRIVALINCALTNTPATKNLTPLVSTSKRGSRVGDAVARAIHLSRERAKAPLGEGRGQATDDQPKDTPMSIIALTLGLNAAAAETEQVSALKPIVALSKDIAKLTGEPDPERAAVVLSAWKESHSKLEATQVELSALKKKDDEREIERLVALGRSVTKITDANEKQVRAAYTTPAAMETYLSIALPAAPPNAPPPPGGQPPPSPSSSSSQVVTAGKSWNDLTGPERHRLANDNRMLAMQMKASPTQKF